MRSDLGIMIHRPASAAIEAALYDDPNYLRLFYRLKNGSVSFLDYVGCPSWRRWPIGKILHWSPFKVELLHTKRAGLHIVTRWRTPGGELRYAANAALDDDGTYVLTPGQVAQPASRIENVVENPFERQIVTRCLIHRFHVDCGVTANPFDVLENIPVINGRLDETVNAAEALAA